jgi:hypothetical protein
MLNMLDFIIETQPIQDSIRTFSKEIAKVGLNNLENSHPNHALEVWKAKYQDQKGIYTHFLQDVDQRSLPSSRTAHHLW